MFKTTKVLVLRAGLFVCKCQFDLCRITLWSPSLVSIPSTVPRTVPVIASRIARHRRNRALFLLRSLLVLLLGACGISGLALSRLVSGSDDKESDFTIVA